MNGKQSHTQVRCGFLHHASMLSANALHIINYVVMEVCLLCLPVIALFLYSDTCIAKDVLVLLSWHLSFIRINWLLIVVQVTELELNVAELSGHLQVLQGHLENKSVKNRDLTDEVCKQNRAINSLNTRIQDLHSTMEKKVRVKTKYPKCFVLSMR